MYYMKYSISIRSLMSLALLYLHIRPHLYMLLCSWLTENYHKCNWMINVFINNSDKCKGFYIIIMHLFFFNMVVHLCVALTYEKQS